MQILNHLEPIQTIAQLIEGIPTAMLTTLKDDGTLHSRPMATHTMELDGKIWFLASRSSRMVATILHHPQINVGYAHPGRQTYVSITGTIALVDEPERARAMWSPLFTTWFKNGYHDTDLAVLCVTIKHADCWEPSGYPLPPPAGSQPAWVEGGSPTYDINRRICL